MLELAFGADDIDGTITEGGELTTSYSVEANNEVKMTKTEIIGLIEDAGFEAVERDTVYNRVVRNEGVDTGSGGDRLREPAMDLKGI